jgi:hypothetical protein
LLHEKTNDADTRSARQPIARRSLRSKTRRHFRTGVRAVSLSTLILLAAGCGGDSASNDGAVILRALLEKAPAYRAYAARRGGLRGIACRPPVRFPSGAIVGCDVAFARRTEHWALIEGAPLQAIACPRTNGPLRTLLVSVCGDT